MKSNRVSFWIIPLILVIGSFFSAIIPPLQSPDELNHIRRAYLLTQGVFVLEAPAGNASGGMIDSGLSAYMALYEVYPFNTDRKLSIDEVDTAVSIKWTHTKIFSPAPGTGFYFPIIYTPQAIGLIVGEKFGLTVNESYLLARFLALTAISIILFCAFYLYPVSPLTIALLIIPMSVFQFSSASLDGISTALSVFSIAAFLRLVTDKEDSNLLIFYLLTISVMLLATSRIHLLPLLTLVLASCFYIKSKKCFVVFSLASLVVFAWIIIALKTTVDTRVIRSASTSMIALSYITHPLAFVNILMATLSNVEIVRGYHMSFLGILGWLDARFSSDVYDFLTDCVLLIAIFSISMKSIRAEWFPRRLLILNALASVFLIFFALLIAWTSHPAKVIEGVQGRYFLVPMIMIAYAISGKAEINEGVFRKVALIFVVILGGVTITATTKLLIERYYLALEQPKQISKIIMTPSAPLTKNKPITLVMTENHLKNLQPLNRIGIMFGTYMRQNPGAAELFLSTSDNQTHSVSFNLAGVSDNQYKYFNLNARVYSSGYISFMTGGGVSSWEAHDEQGSVIATCLVYEYENGVKNYTKGCPRL